MKVKENVDFIFSKDYFSQWMGVEILDVKEKYCLIKMAIKQEMINGLGTVHGGITFAFADSALAFSSNNTGHVSVALNCYINFTKAVKLGDVLIAESILINETKKTGVYDITVKNQHDNIVAGFRGTVYKLDKTIREL